MKILIADNDIQILQSLKIDLNELFPRCEVECFDRPIKLFSYWRNHSESVALVITPVVSSVADGFRILESAATAHLKAMVFLTAQNDNEELEKLSSIRGADGFLCKPFTKAALIQTFANGQVRCSEAGDEPCDLPCVFLDCKRHRK